MPMGNSFKGILANEQMKRSHMAVSDWSPFKAVLGSMVELKKGILGYSFHPLHIKRYPYRDSYTGTHIFSQKTKEIASDQIMFDA